MRFEYYHTGLENIPKLSIDGTVSNSIHFSHWEGNQTPRELKADTSTEIALNLVASPNKKELTQGIELVTNNHFDTDGVLSVWTVLTGDRAIDLRDQLIGAAEAGDFSEFSNEDAVRASIAIQGSDQASPDDDSGSPLAQLLAGKEVDDDALAYELVLPEVENVLTKIEDYEELWRGPWERIAAALDSFEKGSSRVEEFPATGLSLITLAPQVFSPSGFNPTRHAAPYTAISRYARGNLFLIATPVPEGWIYRIDYPYYSWAETVVRPRVKRHDFTTLIAHLNERDQPSKGSWKLDNREMTSAVKFIGPDNTLAPSKLSPADVAQAFRSELSVRQPASVSAG
jgi:hypothetical protein